jgi:hypothetical protein
MSKSDEMYLAVDLGHSVAGDKLNGTVWTDEDEMLEAIRKVFGADCQFGIIDGTVIDGEEEEVATFGRP